MKILTKKTKPFIEGLAVGSIFVTITMLFQLPMYMSLIIGALATVGGYRNSIKMDEAALAKKRQHEPDNEQK